MPFDPTLAAVRFGTGLSPIFAQPSDADALMAELAQPAHYPIPGYADTRPSLRAFQQAAQAATRHAAPTQPSKPKMPSERYASRPM